MPDEPNPLGEYLRARRELVPPASIGIPVTGTRRVVGLRREEVALLAGISVEYYLRLEQGRDRHPSAQVLHAIAGVLGIEDDAYLMGLAEQPTRPRRTARKEVVPPSIRRLVDGLPHPAFVEGRTLDVLAANRFAAALSPRLVVGRNRLRDLFLDPAERALFGDGEAAARALLAGFRRSIGGEVDDPRVIALVGELSLGSEDFRRLWARHDVGPRRGASFTLHHPQVGELRLDREKLAIEQHPGMMLVVHHAEPGTDAADRLGLLLAGALPPFAGAAHATERSPDR